MTVTAEEAAGVLGLGRSTTYEAARRGEIPSRRLGRRIVVPVPVLLQWLGVSVAEIDHPAGDEIQWDWAERRNAPWGGTSYGLLGTPI